MRAEVKYISAGVNQTPRCFSWSGEDDLVAYAADTTLLLYEPKTSSIVGASIKLHTQKITSVHWVQSSLSSENILISTGNDCKAVLWTISKIKNEGLFTLQSTAILDHEESVSLADAKLITDGDEKKLLIVTATSDSLYCWTVCPLTGDSKLLRTVTSPGRTFIVSLLLFEVEGAKYPVLACGGHDSRIHIFTCYDLGDYSPVAVLNGHEDWVTTLDIMKEDNGGMLLASGSKDASVRLWRLSLHTTTKDAEEQTETGIKLLKLRSVTFQVASNEDGQDMTISVLLDALLAGHEGLVSEVYWAKSVVNDGVRHQPYKLLSCSKTQDRAIIIWEPEEGTKTSGGIWLEVARLGEVGGNMEGYFACQFSPDCSQVLGCSYQGALHLWENKNGSWDPCVVVGGHFKEVSDIVWDLHGRYLLSTSKDQTTRLHAPWRNTENTAAWHEIGRPQVHGYDMSCISGLGSFKFASGAEEKVIRGFSAPANFIRNFGQICGVNVEEDTAKCEVGEGASVPSLGLSNKAVMMSDLEDDQQTNERQEEVQAYFKPVSLTAPPTEDQLMQNTLWPEAAKLYGHGHDLIALASTSDGSILASSCKAAQEADANIILWDVEKWLQSDVLHKHRLTVTQMEFSPDDEYLLSVSRDRTWTIFKRETLEGDKGFTYKVSDFSKKKETMHSRVIWSCAWLPDSKHFVTASRDKTVAVWSLKNDEWTRVAVLNESDEVTAVAVMRYINSKGEFSHLVATGLVNGSINIRWYSLEEGKFSEDILQVFHKHQRTVKRLRFKPSVMESHKSPTLASCGEDNGVHIYEIIM